MRGRKLSLAGVSRISMTLIPMPVVVLGAALLLVRPADARVADDSTRMVDVLGSPARVMTFRLDDREAGDPVLVLFSGAGTALEGWGSRVA